MQSPGLCEDRVPLKSTGWSITILIINYIHTGRQAGRHTSIHLSIHPSIHTYIHTHNIQTIPLHSHLLKQVNIMQKQMKDDNALGEMLSKERRLEERTKRQRWGERQIWRMVPCGARAVFWFLIGKWFWSIRELGNDPLAGKTYCFHLFHASSWTAVPRKSGVRIPRPKSAIKCQESRFKQRFLSCFRGSAERWRVDFGWLPQGNRDMAAGQFLDISS